MSETLREHIEYISDRRRMERYRAAVAAAVKPGDVVVDLGCGFGVLGLLCLEAGAASVWGIDRTPALEIARETMRRNGLAERYHCVAESSFLAQLPVKADVLICDHVGYFGFDYDIVRMIADARARFLRPGGIVLPQRIELKLAGISSAAQRAITDAWSAEGIHPDFAWLQEFSANTKHSALLDGEAVATSVADLGSIDLASEDRDYLSWRCELVAAQRGTLDGLAGWFEATLFGDVRMTNSPLSAEAITRPQAVLPFDPPLPVEPGDVLEATVSARFDPITIAWTVVNRRNGERRRHTTWRSQILTDEYRQVPADRVATLGPMGQARQRVLALTDGSRTHAEIRDVMLAEWPALFPSEALLRKFIQSELRKNSA